MNMLNKIEDLINAFLTKFIDLVKGGIRGITPLFFRVFLAKLKVRRTAFFRFLKKSPWLLKEKVIHMIHALKHQWQEIEVKGTYQRAIEKYKGPEGHQSKFKLLILTPFLMFGVWLRGLSFWQRSLLVTCTIASIVSMAAVVQSIQSLRNHGVVVRKPASVEVAYERPDYYKKETRFFEMRNLTLPVYVPGLNQIRTVDLDFTATMSNREVKMKLEERDIQIRDHLTLNVEPLSANFPLEDEGKEIIRQKLILELDEYIKEVGLEGYVEEINITYFIDN
jgi:flagellar basal body-associated protein FliL